MTETLAFHIDFDKKGDYVLQFCHQFQADLADVCVDMTGLWHVEMGEIHCETSEVPTVNLDGTVVGCSRVPVRFSLPLSLLLRGPADLEGRLECRALRWEESIRSRSLQLDFSRMSKSKVLHIEEDEDDEEVSEAETEQAKVCNDISENCDQQNCEDGSWANLGMFGLHWSSV
jgi:hypothetical protein